MSPERQPRQTIAHWMRGLIATALLGCSAALSMGARAALDPAVAAAEARRAERAAEAEALDLGHLAARAELLRSGLAEASVLIEERNDRLAATPSILPTRGRFTSSFTRSRWHPVLNRSRPHNGLDIRAPRGTPIKAAARGRVRFAGWKQGYGLTIEIDHGNGHLTRYAHASRLVAQVGEKVEKGQKVAEVGATGLAEAPHLHYEVIVNGRPANPRRFIYNDPPRN